MLSLQRTRFIKGFAIGTSIVLAIGVGAVSVPAWGSVPSPSADEVVLHFPVLGDRTSGGPQGTIGAPVGVMLDLVAAGVPLSQSWASCVVDAQGDCSFVVPVADISAPATYSVVVDSSSPGWEIPPLTVSSIDVPAGTQGGVTINSIEPLALERINPALPATCGVDGLNVAMVVDLSSSMVGDPLVSLKSAATGFVNAMAGTNTQIQLFTFATTAPADVYYNNNRPLWSIATQAGVDTVNQWINGWTATEGSTNWDAGLAQVAFSGQKFDFVILITDGGPNTTARQALSVSDMVAQNTASANALKAMGTRIMVFAVGIEPRLLDSALLAIASVSGPSFGNSNAAKNDYFMSDWSTLAPLLLSMTTMCDPTIQTVNIQYVDDDNNGALVQPASGATTSLYGSSGSDVGFSEADAKAGVPGNYVYVSIDNVDTYDDDVSVDQTITVHVKHDHSVVDVPVTRTIQYVGSPSVLADEVQSVTWVKDTDLVTNTSSCSTSSTSYPSVISPVVAGYQPDVVTVLAQWITSPVAVCPADSSVTVTYSADMQRVDVQYVDDDASGAVVAGAGKTLTGQSGSAVGFSETDAKAGVPVKYLFVSLDNVTTYDVDASVDQTITVHVKHNHSMADVPVTRTIHYTGSPNALADNVQTITWNKDTDLVTSVSSCSTSSTGYPSVTSPTVAGYQPDSAVIPATTLTSPVAVCPADSSVTVTYSADMQRVDVQYVDDDASGAVVAGAGTTLTGPSGSPVGFSEADAKAGVPVNYLFVSLDNVTTYDVDASVDQTITVHVKHDHGFTDVPVTRTIHYTGSPNALVDNVQTITWVKDTDLVTSVSSCSTSSTGYPSVTSPTVAGYQPDSVTIPATTLTSPVAVCPADSSVTVTYSADMQRVDVQYVDDDASGAVVTGAGKTLTGQSGSTVGFSETDAKAGVPVNYLFVSLDNVTTYDLDASVNQTITVHLKHVVTFADVPVTRTVHYVGSPNALVDNVQTITWTRSTDMVTSVNSCSTSSMGYPSVTSPVVPGYQPDVVVIAAMSVTSPVAVCPADSSVTVTYSADMQRVDVQYVDDDASGAFVADAGKTLTGPSGSPVGFSEADAKAGMPVNYLFVSLDNVTTYDLDASVDQTITVHVKHDHSLVDVPVTRTIQYVGSPSALADNVQTITWVKDTDLVTSTSSCSTSSTGYPSVDSPVVPGHQPDAVTIPATTLTSPVAVCPADSSITVTYSADMQRVDVQYVDDDASGAVVADAGKALTGPSGSPVGFSEADAKAGVPSNYLFVSLDNVTRYDLDASVNQTITVHLKHVVTLVDVPVTRTIHYAGEGDGLPPDVVSTINWVRATDEVTKVSSFTTSSTGYPEIKSPQIDGHTVDIAVVAGSSVTSPMDVCPANTIVTVTYTPVPVAKTGGNLAGGSSAGLVGAFCMMIALGLLMVHRRQIEATKPS